MTSRESIEAAIEQVFRVRGVLPGDVEGVNIRKIAFRANDMPDIRGLDPLKYLSVRDMLDEGYSMTQAGSVAGVARETVSRWFPGRGMSPQDAGRISGMSKQLERIGA